ncbi:MFS transporter [Kitasatospora sp. SUK 42]|uniref:MFS transporter n=1 Tax=Kitasatospora sp. SUK 42 TaxID=1588882 RepID=UPI0018CA0332|nr:MFS transporter [Kitasatospora sp. SUK 42]MBV2153137.1 MFS transporter [Kitasatospora sp. SUK 42]
MGKRQGADGRVWLLALGMFAIGTDLFVVSGLLPDVGRDLGQSTASAGQITTVFAATYAVAAPLLASLTARVERRVLLLAVLAVFALGNALSALAPDFAVLLLSRVITGAGAALYSATASAVAARITPSERRGRALAVVYAGMTSAIALGVPLGNEIGALASWRWAFGFVALLALITVGGLAGRLPSVPGAAGLTVRQRLGAVRIRRAPGALITTALWIVGTFSLYTYLGTVLDTVTGVGADGRSWLLLLFGVGSFAGVLIGGRLADRVDARRALPGTVGALAVVLVLLAPALHSVAGAAVGLLLWGLVHWLTFPLIQHRLLAIGGTNGDMLLALNNSAAYLGQTVAAVVGGLFASAGRLDRLPLAAAGIMLLAALCALATGGPRAAEEPRAVTEAGRPQRVGD